MLAKKFRLSSARAVWRAQPRRLNRFLVRLRRTSLPYSRFGISISRAVLGRAVGRNELRRFVYNYIRLHNLHRVPGNDVALNALRGAAGIRQEELSRDLALLDNILKKK